ncbi:MAG TPA: methionine adenosyltransferase [Methanomassiliicoccales archaeon]|nr:methionine adenosyltransferase [Methanomassiliicoccales archaeon]
MSKNIIVEKIDYTPVEQQQVELVERKGIGHPDSIADGLSESVSRALCRMYLERYDRVLHHNTDETQIVGGQSSPRFGGGDVLEPIYILLVGRATTEVNGERLPYRSTAVRAAYEYLKNHFPNLDLETDTMIDCRIGKGSVDLRAVYESKKLLSNDTSFGVGYAPYSHTERVVLESEKFINGNLKRRYKETGEDVKVMASRMGDTINLTCAIAMVDRYIPDPDHYQSAIAEICQKIADNATKYTDLAVNVDVNTADNYKNGTYYLTVTGLSMENGDDGSVGRGNRVNGLITPYRPMSMEASAGKNPITHVGKLYNILSKFIAEDIAAAAKGDVLEAEVRILSQIGKPIDNPQTCSVQLITAPGANYKKWEKEARAIASNWLDNIDVVTKKIVNGEITVF